MNVLIISAHPRKESFSSALADAFYQGCKEAGKYIRSLVLAELNFNPNVLTHSPKDQHFEEDLKKAQQDISWADHIVFVYPTWWGSMPALMKAFIDRVFTAGFAFEEIEGGTGYAQLLNGKTAQLITTMDTPLWIYKWIYKSPGHRSLGVATLKFCGINPVRILNFSSVRHSTEAQRKKWLLKTKKQALKLKNGKLSKAESLKKNSSIWLKALRLQFYPMTALAYAVGALSAKSLGLVFDNFVFWMGFLWIFFLEVATVLLNEKQDYVTDKENKYFGPFTGGSRVIVENHLSFSQMQKGILLSIVLSAFFGSILLITSPAPFLTVFVLILLSTFLAFGYSVPPLKLDYKGLGAFDVGFTHSFGVIICGFVFQGGNWHHPLPWLLSIPLFLSILPSIILAGIPDSEADKLAGKKTPAVRWGNKNAAKLALLFTVISVITAIVFKLLELVPIAYSNFIYASMAHALYLCYHLNKYIQNASPPKRIDLLMVLSLSFIMWFVLLPFFRMI